MSGPPPLRKRKQAGVQENKAIYGSLQKYEVPRKCTKPDYPKGEGITLYAFEQAYEEARRDSAPTGSTGRSGGEAGQKKDSEGEVSWKQLSLPMTERALIIGSDKESEGHVLNNHGSVLGEHAALLHNQGKLYLKPINGVTTLYSISEVKDLVKDNSGRRPRIYVNTKGNKEMQLQGG